MGIIDWVGIYCLSLIALMKMVNCLLAPVQSICCSGSTTPLCREFQANDNERTAPPTASTATSSKGNPSPKPCRIFTITPDLPLTDDEWSVLSKGLTFILFCLHINEYCSRLDFEQFFCCLCFRAYFFN
eukprot:g22579.t1